MNIRGTTPADLFPTFLNFCGVTGHFCERCAHLRSRGETPSERETFGGACATPETGISYGAAGHISLQCPLTVQQTGRTPAAGGERQRLFLYLRFVFYGIMASWIDTRCCAPAGWLPACPSGPGHGALRQNKGWRHSGPSPNRYGVWSGPSRTL